MSTGKAVFVDRDGVINEMVYYPEHGIIDSPFTAGQFRLLPGAGPAVGMLQAAGYRVLLASNQPGMAKGYMTEEVFAEIRREMARQLADEGAVLDGEYYCHHHPEAKVSEMRTICDCRKPQPGLLLRAAEDLSLNLADCWMVGDGITDIQAGSRAGCRTILIARMKCELCQLLEAASVRPEAVLPDLPAAARFIVQEQEGGDS